MMPPITRNVCDRRQMGSYSKAIFGFAIAPTRPGAIIDPSLAAPVMQLNWLQGAKFGFISRSGVALNVTLNTRWSVAYSCTKSSFTSLLPIILTT